MKESKIKLNKLGDLSIWLLKRIGQDSFVITDEIVTAYIDAFSKKGMYFRSEQGYLNRALEAMVANDVITKSSEGSYKITRQGHWEMARRRMLDKPENHTKENWDKKWRIVIFDIPELERKHRDVLRYTIRGYGMYQLQQSVWVYPYSCNKFVESIKEDLGFKAEVLFIVADTIENQSKLEEEFGLRN